jgi:hypothetical protein
MDVGWATRSAGSLIFAWLLDPGLAVIPGCLGCVMDGCVTVTTGPQGKSWAPPPSTEQQ